MNHPTTAMGTRPVTYSDEDGAIAASGTGALAVPAEPQEGLAPDGLRSPIAVGVYSVRYPFIRETVTLYGEEGPYECRTWRPGVSIENCGPYGEDTSCVANGEGEMILTVIDVHKPGRFPTRVFFTRQFRDPNGRVFGKTGLRITTLDAFRRRATSYQVAYDVEDMGNV